MASRAAAVARGVIRRQAPVISKSSDNNNTAQTPAPAQEAPSSSNLSAAAPSFFVRSSHRRRRLPTLVRLASGLPQQRPYSPPPSSIIHHVLRFSASSSSSAAAAAAAAASSSSSAAAATPSPPAPAAASPAPIDAQNALESDPRTTLLAAELRAGSAMHMTDAWATYGELMRMVRGNDKATDAAVALMLGLLSRRGSGRAHTVRLYEDALARGARLVDVTHLAMVRNLASCGEPALARDAFVRMVAACQNDRAFSHTDAHAPADALYSMLKHARLEEDLHALYEVQRAAYEAAGAASVPVVMNLRFLTAMCTVASSPPRDLVRRIAHDVLREQDSLPMSAVRSLDMVYGSLTEAEADLGLPPGHLAQVVHRSAAKQEEPSFAAAAPAPSVSPGGGTLSLRPSDEPAAREAELARSAGDAEAFLQNVASKPFRARARGQQGYAAARGENKRSPMPDTTMLSMHRRVVELMGEGEVGEATDYYNQWRRNWPSSRAPYQALMEGFALLNRADGLVETWTAFADSGIAPSASMIVSLARALRAVRRPELFAAAFRDTTAAFPAVERAMGPVYYREVIRCVAEAASAADRAGGGGGGGAGVDAIGIVADSARRTGMYNNRVVLRELFLAYGRSFDLAGMVETREQLRLVGAELDLIDYTTMMQAYKMAGLADDVLATLEEARAAGHTPSVPLYGQAIESCAQRGRVEDMERLFCEAVRRDHHWPQSSYLFNFMVIGYGYSKMRYRAFELLDVMRAMRVQPTVQTVHVLRRFVVHFEKRSEDVTRALEKISRRQGPRNKPLTPPQAEMLVHARAAFETVYAGEMAAGKRAGPSPLWELLPLRDQILAKAKAGGGGGKQQHQQRK